MNNQCTIAQKEGIGHAMPILSIQFIKDNCPTIGHLKKRVDEVNRFVANNGRCTLVSPIDKNTSGQPQTFCIFDMARTENTLNIGKVKDVRPFSSLNHVNQSIAIKFSEVKNG